MTHDPSFDLLGSYFPSWMLCIGGGVAAAVVVRLLLRRWDVEYHLVPLVLIYPCLAAFFCFSLWLMFFSAN